MESAPNDLLNFLISNMFINLGHGGGQVVSVLAYYSDDPCSSPIEAYSFSVKFVFEKNKNKQEEAGVGTHFFKKTMI